MCHLTHVGSDGPAVCQLASLGPNRVQWQSHSGTGSKLQCCRYRQAIVLVYNPLIVFSEHTAFWFTSATMMMDGHLVFEGL